MNILIAGATGLVGKALVSDLTQSHQLGVIGRSISKLESTFESSFLKYTWEDIQSNGNEILKNYDVVINLSGENIGAKRWSDAQKEKIKQSRVDATNAIAQACIASKDNTPRIFNASALGIYDYYEDITSQREKAFDEQSDISVTPKTFLAQVATAWENALKPAEQAGIKVVKMRFSVVLSKDGGALKELLPSFKLGMGGVLGTGKQPFSWVSIDDLVKAIVYLIDHPEIEGPVNIAAPNVVTQKQFAKTLASVIHRPCLMRMPTFFVKIIFGQMGEELLLNGQNIQSDVLLNAGFKFDYPKLDQALEHLLT